MATAQTQDQTSGPSVDVVIMAAGKGTRMKSRLPKVLHRLGGRTLLGHVLDTARALQARQAVVITGHGAAEVEADCAASAQALAPLELQFVRQEPQLGTGHAVQQALPVLADDGMVLVLSGDVPLTQPATLFHLIKACGGGQLALLTLEMAQPDGYGRIVRNGGAADGAVQASSNTRTPAPSNARLPRFTAASWPHRLRCSSAGWRGWTTATPKASTT